jgi:hypothetical protein
MPIDIQGRWQSAVERQVGTAFWLLHPSDDQQFPAVVEVGA